MATFSSRTDSLFQKLSQITLDIDKHMFQAHHCNQHF